MASPAVSGTFTVTGYTGAGVVLTAKVFTGIVNFAVDIPDGMIKLTDRNGKITDIAINAATTFTVTLSGANGNYTVSIS
jgi:hypothetical protein